mmetsp:Transcript_10971/g.15461  ORF Transcript_10971/g.15461 Transcript_10971/m.15461 type:complete len:669 (-) Transcript_10971:407-2413(-)
MDFDDNEQNQNKPKHSESEYLFHGAVYHPVQEYMIDAETEDKTESIPDFVLEVTWPRVALFYHPSSQYSLDIQQKYVALARSIRHRSVRIPIEFWALSCEAYRDSCTDLDITSVPTLLAFPMGDINGKHIKRTKDNDILISDVVDAIGITLDKERKSPADHEPKTNDVQQEQQQKYAVDEGGEQEVQGAALEEAMIRNVDEEDVQERPLRNIDNQPDENIRAILHPHAALQDVFADAVASFLFSLDQSIRTLSSSATATAAWKSSKQYLALRDFLDFLHWTLPSRDMAGLHNFVNDLRNNIDSIIRSPEEIIKILTSHDYYSHPELFQTWSSSCAKQRQDGGYACGLWKLLHVVSIGVTKQHSKVMGDLDRVRVSHCIKTIRNYLVEFGFQNDLASRQFIIDAYNNCLDSEECLQDLGIQKQSFFFLRKHPIPPPTDKTWNNLSIWLWQIHNTYRTTGGADDENSQHKRYDSLLHKEEIQWPQQSSCPKCYSDSIPVANGEDGGDVTTIASSGNLYVDHVGNVWDKNAVFQYLESEYWPKSLQSPRLVVLDRWDKRKFLFRRRTESGEIVLHWFELIGFVAMIVAGVFWYPKWKLQRSGQHKKKDVDVYGIDDYLIETGIQEQQQQDQQKQTVQKLSMKRSTRRRGSIDSHGGSKHRGTVRIRAFLDD